MGIAMAGSEIDGWIRHCNVNCFRVLKSIRRKSFSRVARRAVASSYAEVVPFVGVGCSVFRQLLFVHLRCNGYAHWKFIFPMLGGRLDSHWPGLYAYWIVETTKLWRHNVL
jgi:hypothetical protein